MELRCQLYVDGRKKEVKMQTIKIKNKTTLTDFSALFRAALYLSGDREQAEGGGIRIYARENGIHRTIMVTEGDGKR